MSANDTGVLPTPTTAPTGFDAELRQDLTSAAWLMASVTVPGLALMAVLMT